MARYEKGRKGETRRRIVELASRRFRAEGVDGVGIASLMADAGLTNGGFYAHFASKEELIKEAILHAMSEVPAEASRLRTDAAYDLPTFIADYLSVEHRDHPETGCVMAALSPELTRRPAASRGAFQDESAATIDHIASALPSSVQNDDRIPRAIAVMSHLLGTLQVARLTVDRTLSAAILERGRSDALRLAGYADTGQDRASRLAQETE